MRFWLEWAVAVHQAIWFPVNWWLGFERPGVPMPAELSPGMAAMVAVSPLTITGTGRRVTATTRPAGLRARAATR